MPASALSPAQPDLSANRDSDASITPFRLVHTSRSNPPEQHMRRCEGQARWCREQWLKAGVWRLVSGGWCLEAGVWRLVPGGWCLEAGAWPSPFRAFRPCMPTMSRQCQQVRQLSRRAGSPEKHSGGHAGRELPTRPTVASTTTQTEPRRSAANRPCRDSASPPWGLSSSAAAPYSRGTNPSCPSHTRQPAQREERRRCQE